jgi:hypothetical protein
VANASPLFGPKPDEKLHSNNFDAHSSVVNPTQLRPQYWFIVVYQKWFIVVYQKYMFNHYLLTLVDMGKMGILLWIWVLQSG